MTTKRTAPALSKGNFLNQSLSEPDLATGSAGFSPASEKNITLREKRHRMYDSPREVADQPLSAMLNEFRVELMNMLSSWKSQQEESLASWRAEQASTMLTLANDIAELKKQVQQNIKTTSEIELGMEFINHGYEDMKSKISNIESVKSVNTERLSNLEKQLQDIHTQSRSTTIELRNVPLKENGKESVADLLSVVKAVGTAVNLELRPSDLRDVYRIPSKHGSPTTPTSIVADFASVNTRYEFLSSVKRFNKSRSVQDKLNSHTINMTGNKTPIYVDERLTPYLRKLLFDTRKISKENGFSCWHSNGKIFLRKSQSESPIRVISERNLADILRQK